MQNKLKELRDNYIEQARNIFISNVQHFLKFTPRIKAVGWLQYTPHFNDGDECIFEKREFKLLLDDSATTWSVCGDYGITFNDETGSVKSIEMYNNIINMRFSQYAVTAKQYIPEAEWEDIIDYLTQLTDIDTCIYNEIFGDHKEIIIRVDTYEINDHEHD